MFLITAYTRHQFIQALASCIYGGFIVCVVPSHILFPLPCLLAIGVTTEEQNKEITVEVTAEQEPEPSEPQAEVNEEGQSEDTEQPPTEEAKEEPQPEEQPADTTAPDDEEKPKEEESTTVVVVVQEEAPPAAPQSGGTEEEVTEPTEETTTTEQEQPLLTKDEPEIQPAADATSESAPATTEEKVKEEEPAAAVAEPAEVVKEKPKRPVRNKVRSTVPTEGVDLAMGDGPLEGADPITFGQMFKITLEKYANVPALKWKVQAQEGEGEEAKMVWKTATFAEYYKFCIDAAKSLIKVQHDCNYYYCPIEAYN